MQETKKQENSIYFICYTLLAIMLVNSLYLSYKYMDFYYWGGMMKSFDCVEDCDAVMMSDYSILFGLPVPAYGLAYFIVIAALFFYLHYQAQRHSEQSEESQGLIKNTFKLFLILGCVFALGFLYILYFKLEMFCKFCLLSHTSLFLFTGVYFFGFQQQGKK